EITEILNRAAAGDEQALTDLLSQYRDRLKRMVKLRLNRRLAGRVDESDVLQDVMLHVSQHLDEYQQNRQTSFFLWLRRVTELKLLAVHRRHLGTDKRDAAREISLHRGGYPTASSASLAAQLLGRLTTPSLAAVKAEMRIQLQEALNSMDPIDREVLTLRHFEQLSNEETAQVLEIQESAASKRYVRALERLQSIMAKLSDFS
ncbi:sigma-70 family RNA polymerase sigma factor, partial [Planctomycetota bacterium]